MNVLFLWPLLLWSTTLLKPGYNLDFEKIDPQSKQPYGWDLRGKLLPSQGYFFSIDSTTVKQGRYALLMTTDPAVAERTAGVCTYRIAGPFTGNKIRLSGMLKTERVSPGGFAGLFIRVEGPNGMLAFDNMEKRQVNGTSDWTAYSTLVPLAPGATHLLVGGWLSGGGKAWIDDLQIEFFEP